MQSLDLRVKQADSEYCPPHLPSGRRQQTAANPEAWRELQARCLGRLGHTARARVPGLYLGLLRLRPGSGTGLPQHEGGTQRHERSLRPLTHLRLGSPRERPRPAQASAALAILACPRNSSQSAKGCGRGVYVRVQSGSFNLPTPGPNVGGAEAGTGRSKDGTQASSRETRDQEDACRAGCWCSGGWGGRCCCIPAPGLAVPPGLWGRRDAAPHPRAV